MPYEIRQRETSPLDIYVRSVHSCDIRLNLYLLSLSMLFDNNLNVLIPFMVFYLQISSFCVYFCCVLPYFYIHLSLVSLRKSENEVQQKKCSEYNVFWTKVLFAYWAKIRKTNSGQDFRDFFHSFIWKVKIRDNFSFSTEFEAPRL